MKIFIVTNKDDGHIIDSVFLDKHKAEFYCKNNQALQIEEFETADKKVKENFNSYFCATETFQISMSKEQKFSPNTIINILITTFTDTPINICKKDEDTIEIHLTKYFSSKKYNIEKIKNIMFSDGKEIYSTIVNILKQFPSTKMEELFLVIDVLNKAEKYIYD